MFQTILLALVLAPEPQLQSLINRALEANPEILAARARLQAARHRPAIERSLPDPMLSAAYASVGGPLPGQGLGREPMARAGFMASQTLPAPGTRTLKAGIAAREADAMQQDYLQTQLSVVARLKTAWHRLHHAYEMTGIIAANRALLERILAVTEARYQFAKASQQDLFKLHTQLTLLEAKRTRFEQERLARASEINALTVRPLNDPVPRPPDMDAHPLTLTLDQLIAQAQQRAPAIVRERASIERSSLALNLARKDGSPAYTVSAGYFNMGSMPPLFEARLDLSLPFFTRARQRAAVAEQAGSLTAARRSYQAAGNTLAAAIHQDWLMSQSALRLLNIYSSTLTPQANLAMESALTAYQSGQADLLMVLMNAMAVLEAQESYHEALMDYHLALVRLEEMTGLILTQEN